MFQIADIPDVLECSRLLKPIVPIFELFAAPGPPDCGPVEDVEEEEQHWEDDQEGQVCHLMGEQSVNCENLERIRRSQYEYVLIATSVQDEFHLLNLKKKINRLSLHK